MSADVQKSEHEGMSKALGAGLIFGMGLLILGLVGWFGSISQMDDLIYLGLAALSLLPTAMLIGLIFSAFKKGDHFFVLSSVIVILLLASSYFLGLKG